MADFGQSILRTIRDLSSDPRAYLEMVSDRLNNFNKGRAAEASDRGLGYRTLTPDERVTQFVRGATDNIGGGGMGALGVIKNKGGNWLNGSVEKALSGLKRDVPPFEQEHLNLVRRNRGQAIVDQMIADMEKHNAPQRTINNWIEGPLTKYIKRDMATEGDPVRRLAEQGILHWDPRREVTSGTIDKAMNLRANMRFPTGGYGESQLARAWEDLSDASLGGATAAEWKANAKPEVLEKMPWIDRISPEEKIYERSNPNMAGSLNFNHLTDELFNALNPESGLPRHLMLNPEDFQQMGMERAVRHVDAINKWRAAQKAEADAMRANNAATVLHKEYPENNPLGLRWVELKARGPKATSLEAAEADQAAMRQELADALKYEGDTMGHCVGGYCDDVVNGRSRIYSLRDAKGQPHVTIETRPGVQTDNVGEWPDREIVDAVYGNLPKRMHNKFSNWVEENYDTYDSMLDAIRDSEWNKYVPYSQEVPGAIVQIKGKQNRAPNPEYLPFVQDFVKSGKWSDVGDIQNTGLRRSRDVWNEMERKRIQEAGHEIPEYATMDDIKALNAKVWPGDDVYNFAEGGLVTNHRRALPENEMPAIISNYQP